MIKMSTNITPYHLVFNKLQKLEDALVEQMLTSAKYAKL